MTYSRISFLLAKWRVQKDGPTPLTIEATTKTALECTFPLQVVQSNAVIEPEELPFVRYQHLLDIKGCIPKHCRKKPKVKGSSYTGASFHLRLLATMFWVFILWCLTSAGTWQMAALLVLYDCIALYHLQWKSSCTCDLGGCSIVRGVHPCLCTLHLANRWSLSMSSMASCWNGITARVLWLSIWGCIGFPPRDNHEKIQLVGA